MEKLKEKYQFIIGFVAIIISLSSFKNELKSIEVNLSFYSFDLSQLFFWLIIGYLITIQLYIIPFIFLGKFPNNKLLKFISNLAYVTFVLLSLTPILVSIIYLFDWLIGLIPPISFGTNKVLSGLFTSLIGGIAGYFSRAFVIWYKREKTKVKVEELEEKEIKELETSKKLAEDGYYAQAILEISKTIETRLYRSLISLGIEIKRRNLLELLRACQKNEILNENEISSIDELRVMRNKVVHEIEIEVGKDVVIKFQELVHSIIEKINKIEKQKVKESSPFFKGKVFSNLTSAKFESEKKQRPIFMVIFDGSHSKNSRLEWTLGYFMEYDTTKKLVNDNFVQVIVDKTKENVSKYIPENDPLEKCLLVVIYNDQIIRQETVYANPDEGMKRVKETIKKIKATNTH